MYVICGMQVRKDLAQISRGEAQGHTQILRHLQWTKRQGPVHLPVTTVTTIHTNLHWIKTQQFVSNCFISLRVRAGSCVYS